jgi:hypothetical protein
MLRVTPSLGIFLADAIHLSALRGRRMMRACSVPSSVRKCTEEPWTDQSPVGSSIELLVGWWD